MEQVLKHTLWQETQLEKATSTIEQLEKTTATVDQLEKATATIDSLVSDLIKLGKDFYEVTLALSSDLDNPELGSRQARAVTLMVVGFVLAIIGHKAIHSMLFVAGLVGTGYSAFRGSYKINRFIDVEKNEVPVFVGVAAMSLMGGFLAVWFMKVGVVILSAILGAGASSIFFSLNLVTDKERAPLVFVSSSLVSAMLTYFLADVAIVVTTSLLGALIFLIGLDYLTKLGVHECASSIRSGKELIPSDMPILGSLALIALAGSVIQSKFL
ncbi:hypothetical protein DSO57_1023041 [Entomophthora muscae]|uniref:Uncharacterized protein n=1 Tax=Entomophthora muscae TaxID=34485 RepID=A0ACC2UMV4_9FUNG|nr:hypothetical protein DSO57_1023041 [Entomophthora muscae]